MAVLGAMESRGSRLVLLGLLMLVVSMVVGCSSSPRFTRHDITVGLDPTWRQSGNVPSLVVDLVVTSRADELASIPVSEYFAPGRSDGLRANLQSLGQVKTFTFDSSDLEDKRVTSGDAIWNEWQNQSSSNLYVLVNLLGVRDEARRSAISMLSNKWQGRKVNLLIQNGGIANRSIPVETGD